MRRVPVGLIGILQDIQARYGYLPAEALKAVAAKTGRSLVDIYGVATFYRSFSLTPRGKHVCSVCLGTACHVRGGPVIADEFGRELGLEPGETTADRSFTLETVNCLGACALGPIVVVDGHYFSNVSPVRVREIVTTARKGLDKVEVRTDQRIFPVEVSCPRCNHSLMDPEHMVDGYPSIRVTLSFGREHGWMRLSCLYGSYNIESSLEIPLDTLVDFFCPHCHAHLVGASGCPECGVPMIPMIVRGGGVVQICSRRGCKGHILDLSTPSFGLGNGHFWNGSSERPDRPAERIGSVAAFQGLQSALAAARDPGVPVIVISAGTCGQASGANDLIRIAKRELLARGLADKIRLRITGCHGFCQAEPSVLIEPEGTFYPRLGAKEMARVVDALSRGEVAQELLWRDPKTRKRVEKQADIPFFRNQKRTILARNEQIDPIRIYDYIEQGGYSALVKVLERGDPRWIIDEVKTSGLRGRGGAGFPTGRKWELLANQPGDRGKYLVCNADEGDPGAYMDRSVLEGNPHSILEGMLIGAYATGATRGVVYVRTEYPLAVKHLLIALRQARELGLLGNNVLGTGFAFDIEMVKGAGAFVCGEETALIRSIEGNRGEPRQRPPYPVEKGIEGKPTAINNVETWANIPVIINRGGAGFHSGTKIFSLVGKVKNTGLVEVPMGITIGEIVEVIGGGPSGRAEIKAVQTGGPSGGCIPTSLFDLPVDYDSLVEAGSIMGSGGMIVMDENTCMVDVAKYFMKFLKEESCGKCFTCRKGTQRMWEILDDITTGRGTLEQLDLLEELALVVKDTSMCGLGQTASNPVLSTLRYFRDEYLTHIERKYCPATVCRHLFSYRVIAEKCTGCALCVKVCPTNAITGPRKEPHNLDLSKCIKCRACYEVCKFDAIAGDAIIVVPGGVA